MKLSIGFKKGTMRALSHSTFIRRVRGAFCALLVLCSIGPGAVAGADVGRLPDHGKPQPILRVQAGGPTSEIFQLEFSPDGKTLYAAGRDKVIHVWTLREPSGDAGPHFQYRPDLVRRVPIAPGVGATSMHWPFRWTVAGSPPVVTGRSLRWLPTIECPGSSTARIRPALARAGRGAGADLPLRCGTD